MQQENNNEAGSVVKVEAQSGISISINDEVKQVAASTTLQAVIQAYGVARGVEVKAIAAALNAEVVPRQSWPIIHCQAGDKLELFSVVAGG
ncbi:thiamine biosynthesis protein ThiS [Shewanella halifaxensis HAW-EB4]|uniref:Thiamine biosynthesis protein ThiS n=1 Tax=Shewanella halifaxensis (strain HAW-EB4) TaxID=458817 RepID=B0TRQ0_SHEHH|nr:sulfur carrier protein ThiS [Shewanella halifaxensis]ABZ76468.1 thiamine biosynthesis protein ThiS [Shewanella halifaxensis HAW-EB4]